MAAQQKKQQLRRRWVMAPASVILLPFLLVAVLMPLSASGVTSSIFLCMNELQECEGDADCNSCLSTWLMNESSTCEYSIEAGEASCEQTGVSYCCGFEDGDAESCMQNAQLEAYWSCILEDAGCALDDMPCSVDAVLALSAAAPSIRSAFSLSSVYGAVAGGLAAIAVVAASAAATAAL